jgi:hypothetical protein
MIIITSENKKLLIAFNTFTVNDTYVKIDFYMC